MAPDSTIGSLAGENSNRRLQMVDVTTVSSSLDGCPVSKVIKGRQTEWSYRIILNFELVLVVTEMNCRSRCLPEMLSEAAEQTLTVNANNERRPIEPKTVGKNVS